MTNRSNFFINQSPSDDEEFPYWVPVDYLRRKFSLTNASIREFQASPRSQQSGLTRNPALDRSLILLVEQYGEGEDGLRTFHSSGIGNRVKSLLNQQHWKSISRDINTGISPRQCEERYLQLIDAAKVHRQGSSDIRSVYGSYLISSEPVAASRNVRSRNARPAHDIQTERNAAAAKRADVPATSRPSEVTEIATVKPTLKRGYPLRTKAAPAKQSKRSISPPADSVFQALQKAQLAEIKSRKVAARAAQKLSAKRARVQRSADDTVSIVSYSSAHSSDVRSDDSIFDTSSSEESEYEGAESDEGEHAAYAVRDGDTMQGEQKQGGELPEMQDKTSADTSLLNVVVSLESSAGPVPSPTASSAMVTAASGGTEQPTESTLTVDESEAVVDQTDARSSPPEHAALKDEHDHQGQQQAELGIGDDESVGGSSLHSVQSADSLWSWSDSDGSASDLESLCSADSVHTVDHSVEGGGRDHNRRRLSPDGSGGASARASPEFMEDRAMAVKPRSAVADVEAAELLDVGAPLQTSSPQNLDDDYALGDTVAVLGVPSENVAMTNAALDHTTAPVPVAEIAATTGDQDIAVDNCPEVCTAARGLDPTTPSDVLPEQQPIVADGATSSGVDPLANISPHVMAVYMPSSSQRHEETAPTSSRAVSCDPAAGASVLAAPTVALTSTVSEILSSVSAGTVDLLRAMLPKGRYHKRDVDWNVLCSVLQVSKQKCQEIAKALRWQARQRADKHLNAAQNETQNQRKRRLRRCPAKRPRRSCDPRIVKVPLKRALALAAERAAAALSSEKASTNVAVAVVDPPAGIFHHALLQRFLGASVDAALHQVESEGVPRSSSDTAQGATEQPPGDDTGAMVVVQGQDITVATSSSAAASPEQIPNVVLVDHIDQVPDMIAQSVSLSPPPIVASPEVAQQPPTALCSPHVDVAAVAEAIHCAATEIFTTHTTSLHSTPAVTAGQSMPSVTAHPSEFAAPAPPPMHTLPPIASTLMSTAAPVASAVPSVPANRPPSKVHHYQTLHPLPSILRTPLDQRLMAAVNACSEGFPLVGRNSLPLTPALWETISKGLLIEPSFCIERYIILTGREHNLNPYYVKYLSTAVTAASTRAHQSALGKQKGPRTATSAKHGGYGSYDELLLAMLSFARPLKACATVDAAHAIVDEAESSGIDPAQLARTDINMSSVATQPTITDEQLPVFGTNLAPLSQIANKDDRLFAAMKLHRFNKLPCSPQADEIIAELRQGKHFMLVTVQNFGQPLTALQWGTLGGLMDLTATECQTRYWRLLASKLRTREISLQDARYQAVGASGAAIATASTAGTAATTNVSPSSAKASISSMPAMPAIPAERAAPTVTTVPISVQGGIYALPGSTPGATCVPDTKKTPLMCIYEKVVTASAISRSDSSSTSGGAGAPVTVDAAGYSHFADYIQPQQASIPVTQGDAGVLSAAADTPARKRARVDNDVTDITVSYPTAALPTVSSPAGELTENEHYMSEVEAMDLES